MAQEEAQRTALREAMLMQYAKLDGFLLEHAPNGPFLFERFSWAETVYTPFFWRFEFLSYCERFELPRDGRFDRVRASAKPARHTLPPSRSMPRRS